MKAMVCKYCSSLDIVKRNGMYFCRNCEALYTPDEANNLMVDVNFEMPQIPDKDNLPGDIKELLEEARKAKKDGDSDSAFKYYEQILAKDPSSWEANFYSAYYQSMNCRVAETQIASNRLSGCVDTVLKLVLENVTDTKEQKAVLNEITAKLLGISRMLYNGALSHYNEINASIRSNYTQEMLNRCGAARDICYTFGDSVSQLFGDVCAKNYAVPAWITGVTLHNGLMVHYVLKENNKNTIMGYVEKIQYYDPSYHTPVINMSSGACYIATAVYGTYNCPEVWTLRRYRDNSLAETWYGRAFVRSYYAISPMLVKRFGEMKWFRNFWRSRLDKMVKKLHDKGVEDTPYVDKEW